MKLRLRPVLGLLVLASLLSPLAAQEPAEAPEGSVEWIAQQFMKARRFPDPERYYGGELRLYTARANPGAQFHPDKFELDLTVYQQDERTATAVATIADPKENQRSDYYLFFRREDADWQLTAFRTFMPPRGMGQLYAALAAKGKDITKSDMRELQLMQMLQFNNWGMKQMFTEQREQLEAIATGLIRKSVTEIVHGSTRNPRVDESLWEQVRDAGLNYVQLQESGLVELNGAAFGETAVGFFYAPAGVTPPTATPDDYILVLPLEDHWYLYRRQ